MNRKRLPTLIAETILNRSICSVNVGACLVDRFGVFEVGWNSMGSSGMGEHAEASCLRRANRKRLARSTLYVAARRQKSGNTLTARPCFECQRILGGVGKVIYRDGLSKWREL